MKTAIDQLRGLWAAGKYTKALALAASWHDLGDDATRAAITRGNAAAKYPQQYIEMKHDPVALVQAGLTALETRYNLPKASP